MPDPDPAAVTIHDFTAGKLYGTAKVAAVFGRTRQWVRVMIRRKRLTAARLDGRGPWLVSGESVRVLYGSLLLEADLHGPAVEEESEGAAVRRAFADLERLNRRTKKAEAGRKRSTR